MSHLRSVSALDFTFLSRLHFTVYCSIKFLVLIVLRFFFVNAFFFFCRDFRPQNLEKSQERFRLRLYEIYAWGVPLLIAGVAAILDFTATDDAYNTFLRPKFATSSCWFHGKFNVTIKM